MQAERGRRGRCERQRHERIERVVAAVLQPLVPRRRMIGDEHRVEAGSLGRGRELADRVGRAELIEPIDPVGRQPQ